MKRVVLFLLLLAVPLCPALGQPAELSKIDVIELSLGYGFGFPPDSGFLFAESDDYLPQGLDLENLIHRVLLQRALHERLFLEIDYDSERNAELNFLGGNTYSLKYLGREGEFLRELSVGNKYLSIPGSRYVTIDEGNSDSFALRARAAKKRLGLDALVRYGASQQGRRRFRGNRRLVEARLLDVDYLKGCQFLLPDAGIDEGSLRVYRSTRGPPDIYIAGKPFDLLTRASDYNLDNPGGRLSLRQALGAGEELAVSYTKAGRPAGSPLLGTLAIIAPDGTRDDFNFGDYPQYFDSSGSYLYLKKEGLNSYWELRNAYPLGDLFSGELPSGITVSLVFTKTGQVNESYQGLLERITVDPAQAVMFIELRDASGTLPRPFPGPAPFDPPAAPYPAGDPRNPFDPANPIYGGIAYCTEQDSINTLLMKYTVGSDSCFLDYDLIEGSIGVTVDGTILSPSRYSVDYDAGLISFAPGTIGPASDVVITYRYAAPGGGRGDLFAALGESYDLGSLQLRNLTTYTLPIQEAGAPLVGRERPTSLQDSVEASWASSPPEGGSGVLADLKTGGALSVTRANSKGEAIVADMESSPGYGVSVREEAWTLGSRSKLLPRLASPVPLTTRGELRYENYWEERLIGSDTLHALGWDNSANPSFSYGQKAGPYNSADQAEGGEDRSLVLDYSIPSGAADGYVSAVSPLPLVNLKDYPHLFLLLRGEGLSGDAVQLYVELLQVYEEDLNGNDALDEELTSGQAGYATTPYGPLNGLPTVIGSDRHGEANTRLDSEDLDRSGTLDPLGPFNPDAQDETGVVLQPAGGPLYAAQVAVGDSGWQQVCLDLRPLLQSGPAASAAFQSAKAIRLTVKPASPTAPPAVSGRLLINAIRFSGSILESSAPDLLAVREVGSNQSAQVQANALSKSFPQVYEELHGGSSYRDRHSLEEKTLICAFTPTLPQSDEVWVSRRFGSPVDFSGYREFRLYVFLPSGQSFPADSRPALEFLASGQEKYGLRFDPGAFAAGWNEVRVSLEPPYPVQVRGASVGELAKNGALDVWRSVTEVRFGVIAESGALDAAFEFWLDEWHLRDSRWSVDTAFFAEGRVGYRGNLLALGDLPILSDLFLNGGYEWAERGFLESSDRRRQCYSAGLETRLLGMLPVGLQWGGSVDRPEHPVAADPPAFPGGFAQGTRSERFAYNVALETGLAYLPQLEHFYQRTSETSDEVGLTPTEYLFQRSETASESLGLSARYQFPQNLSQSYAYSRTWHYERESAGAAGSGSSSLAGETQSLDQHYEGQVELKWDRGHLQAEALRDETLVSAVSAPPSDALGSYARRLASFFSPAEVALPGARRSIRADRAELSLVQSRSRYLGARLNLEAGYNELNADPAAGVRDASLSSSLSLALPFSPDGGGALELTPYASRSFCGSYSRVEARLGEAQLIGAGLRVLARPPFYYLNPWMDLGRVHELAAVNALASDPHVLGGSRGALKSCLGLEGALKAEPWYLPSHGSLQASSDTSREGQAYAQKRSLRFGLGKDLSIGAPEAGDRLSCDLSWEPSWDYTRKLLGSVVESRSELHLARCIRGDLTADHTLSWVRQRQRPGDASLYLFPNDPSHELSVTSVPASDSLYSLLNVQYRWEQPVRPTLRSLRLLGAGEQPPPIVHEEGLRVENQILLADRKRCSLGATTPLRLSLRHESRLAVREGVQLELGVKVLCGVAERIENGRSLYQTSLGCELRLGAMLSF
jgi:hypothetical protein